MKKFFQQQGYIALVGVLLLGSAILVSLLALSLGIGTGSKIVSQRTASEQSYFLAMTCSEEALENLWEDKSYLGGETLTFANGFCEILPIEEGGDGKKTIKTYGAALDSIRRLKIIVSTTSPQILIDSWETVVDF